MNKILKFHGLTKGHACILLASIVTTLNEFCHNTCKCWACEYTPYLTFYIQVQFVLLKNKIHVSISVWSFIMPKKTINCGICQDEFSTKKTLKVHIRRRHKKTMFICQICKLISYSIDEKILHRINHHKFIKCEKCERTFKEKKGLNRHVRLNHKDLQLNNVISSTNTRPSKSSSTSALVKKSKKGTIIILLKGTLCRVSGFH